MKYLRGKKYNLAKLPHGEGKRESLSSQNANLKTRDVVAEELGVHGATISRDGKFAEALDTLTDTLDPQVKQDVFRNDIRATDEEVLQLANLAKEQPDIAKQVVREARETKSKGGTVGQALDKIAKKKRPVIFSSDSNEWYTPQRYIDAVRKVFYTSPHRKTIRSSVALSST